MKDKLYRYIFKDLDVRGELVQLDQSYKDVLSTKKYPEVLQVLLGELLVVASMLAATIKKGTSITIQLQGNGQISYVAASSNSKNQLRGVSNFKGEILSSSLRELFPEGQMVVTITSATGQNYQGVINIDVDSVAELFSNYFEDSEQLKSNFWLFADGNRAGGLFLQVLPGLDSSFDYDRLWHLSSTITAKEIYELDGEDVLYRLYNEETVNLLEINELNFACSCSDAKCKEIIYNLGAVEAKDILNEVEVIEIKCEQCSKVWCYNDSSLEDIFG